MHVKNVNLVNFSKVCRTYYYWHPKSDRLLAAGMRLARILLYKIKGSPRNQFLALAA